MIKETIRIINKALYDETMQIEVAKELLEQLSILTGRNYSILSNRVVYTENGQYHDAWANA